MPSCCPAGRPAAATSSRRLRIHQLPQRRRHPRTLRVPPALPAGETRRFRPLGGRDARAPSRRSLPYDRIGGYPLPSLRDEEQARRLRSQRGALPARKVRRQEPTNGQGPSPKPSLTVALAASPWLRYHLPMRSNDHPPRPPDPPMQRRLAHDATRTESGEAGGFRRHVGQAACPARGPKTRIVPSRNRRFQPWQQQCVCRIS